MKYVPLLFAMLFSISISSFASPDGDIWKRLNAIYQEKDISSEDVSFLMSIQEEGVEQWPDSMRYRYHYLLGKYLDLNDGERASVVHHLSEATALADSRKVLLTGGYASNEYLEMLMPLASAYKEEGDTAKAIRTVERIIVRGYWPENRLGKRNSSRNELLLEALLELANLYESEGFDRYAIEAVYEWAFDVAKAYYQQVNSGVDVTLLLFADFLSRVGDIDAAIEQCERLIEFLESHGGSRTERCIMAYCRLELYLWKKGNYAEEIVVARKAISLCEQVGVDAYEHHCNLLLANAKAGNIESLKIEKERFEQLYRLRIGEEEFMSKLWLLSQNLPFEYASVFDDELMQGLDNLNADAKILFLIRFANSRSAGSPAEAVNVAKKAMEQLTDSEPNVHTYSLLYQLCSVLHVACANMNDYDEALSYAKQALAHLDMIPDVDARTKLSGLYALCNIYFLKGDFENALVLSGRMLESAEKAYGKTSEEYLWYLNTKAVALIRLGNANEAIEICERILSLAQADTYSPLCINVLHNLGRAYMLKGEKEKAIDNFRASLKLQRSVGQTFDNTIKYLNELGIYE